MCFIPMAATVDFMVSRIDQIAPVLLLVDHLSIPTLKTVTWTLFVKWMKVSLTRKVQVVLKTLGQIKSVGGISLPVG